MKRKSGKAGFLGDFVKGAITIIAMEEERLTIPRTGLQRIDLRIHVAVSNKKIQPGIVIHIKESRPPANIWIAGLSLSGGPTHIVEPLSALVQIQRVGLLFKVGNKK